MLIVDTRRQKQTIEQFYPKRDHALEKSNPAPKRYQALREANERCKPSDGLKAQKLKEKKEDERDRSRQSLFLLLANTVPI